MISKYKILPVIAVLLTVLIQAGTDGTIRGKVTDLDGVPLAGANIVLPDIGNGAAAGRGRSVDPGCAGGDQGEEHRVDQLRCGYWIRCGCVGKHLAHTEQLRSPRRARDVCRVLSRSFIPGCRPEVRHKLPARN